MTWALSPPSYLAPNGQRRTAPKTFARKGDAEKWLTLELCLHRRGGTGLEALPGQIGRFEMAVLPAGRFGLGVPRLRLVGSGLSGEHECDGGVLLGLGVHVDVPEDHGCVCKEIGVDAQ